MKSSEVKGRKKEQEKLIKTKFSALIQSFGIDDSRYKKDIKKLSRKLAKKIKGTDQLHSEASSEASSENLPFAGGNQEPDGNLPGQTPTLINPLEKTPSIKPRSDKQVKKTPTPPHKVDE